MHRYQIVHLDIKPDNILIAHRNLRQLEMQHPLECDTASHPLTTPIETTRSLVQRSLSGSDWDLTTPRPGAMQGSPFLSFPSPASQQLDPLIPIETSDVVFKIGDFGQARRLEELADADGVEGDCIYMAPELLDTSASRNKLTAAVDIFSLGLCLLELATSVELPTAGPVWHDLREGRLARHVQGCSPLMAAVIQALLHPDPARRPTAQQIDQRPSSMPLSPNSMHSMSATELNNASSLLAIALKCLEVEDTLSPITILGFKANLGMARTMAGLGLSAVGASLQQFSR